MQCDARLRRLFDRCGLPQELDVHCHSDSVTASFDEQRVILERTDVAGLMLVDTGAREDFVRLTDCDVGTLDVRTGAGNDTLLTEGSTWGEASSYDGSKGREDVWRTDSATDALSRSGVEVLVELGN